jgi:rhamnosyltransferase subunit B
MHVVMSCIGTCGDVLPQVAVGGTLASRGHEVVLFSAAYFQGVVENAGLNFLPVMSREDYLAGVRDPDVRTKARGMQASRRHFCPV